jgi:radical SAM protein (TIGR01212 family)
MTYPWGNNRRINAASNYLRDRFGTRIQKVAIDAGFTCPNRDGSISTGGCAYCSNDAFNPSYCKPEKTIKQQIDEGIEFHEKRYRSATQYLAYFQAYSNTYGTLDRLKDIYEEALSFENITGLIIGTRPDCIDEPLLKYLSVLAEKYYIVIEYGIESVNNKTLEYINRGHTYEDAVKAIELTVKYGIYAGAHFIFGFPGESVEEMARSAQTISQLPLHSIKFHQLQIIKGTRFEKEYLADNKKFTLFSLEGYIDFMANYLAYLNPDFKIERLANETQPWFNVVETWKIRYDRVLQLIEKKMEEWDVWQGKYYRYGKQP